MIEFDRYDRFAICAGARRMAIRRFSTHSDFHSSQGTHGSFSKRDISLSSSLSSRPTVVVCTSIIARPLCERGKSNILPTRVLRRSICIGALVCIVHVEILHVRDRANVTLREKMFRLKIARVETSWMRTNAICSAQRILFLTGIFYLRLLRLRLAREAFTVSSRYYYRDRWITENILCCARILLSSLDWIVWRIFNTGKASFLYIFYFVFIVEKGSWSKLGVVCDTMISNFLSFW